MLVEQRRDTSNNINDESRKMKFLHLVLAVSKFANLSVCVLNFKYAIEGSFKILTSKISQASVPKVSVIDPFYVI